MLHVDFAIGHCARLGSRIRARSGNALSRIDLATSNARHERRLLCFELDDLCKHGLLRLGQRLHLSRLQRQLELLRDRIHSKVCSGFCLSQLPTLRRR